MNLNVNDLLRRAAHTFWQAFLAALGLAYTAGTFDLSQVSDLASAKKFGLALGTAVLAAALSALKTTVASLLSRPSKVDDTGPGFIDGPTQYEPDHAAPSVTQPVTHAAAATPQPATQPAPDQATAFRQAGQQP